MDRAASVDWIVQSANSVWRPVQVYSSKAGCDEIAHLRVLRSRQIINQRRRFIRDKAGHWLPIQDERGLPNNLISISGSMSTSFNVSLYRMGLRHNKLVNRYYTQESRKR